MFLLVVIIFTFFATYLIGLGIDKLHLVTVLVLAIKFFYLDFFNKHICFLIGNMLNSKIYA